MSLKNKKHLLAISLPIIIISICIFWIVRLELNAAALASRVDELHNSLKQNKDNLANLESFYREVNKSGITLDKKGGMLYKGDSQIIWNDKSLRVVNKGLEFGINQSDNLIYMINDNIQITMGDVKKGGIVSKGLKVGIGSGSDHASLFINNEEIQLWATENKKVLVGVTGKQKSSVLFTNEGARLRLGPQEDFYVNLSHDENRIELKKDKSKIVIGDGSATTTSGVTTPTTGVFLQEVNTGSIGIAKDKGIAIKNLDDNGIKISTGKDFQIELRPKENLMKLKKDKSEIQIGKTRYGEGLLLERMDSQVQIGQTKFGEGISFGEKNTSTLSIVKGRGIAIRTEGIGNEMKITGEDKLVITFQGDIDINAYGNLNLNSLNGNVNLVGKRINFNE